MAESLIEKATKYTDLIFDADGLCEQYALILVLCAVALVIHMPILFMVSPAKHRGPDGAALLPHGGSYGKNAVAAFMAVIARKREFAKSSTWSKLELENWHTPDVHKFWNESYYWNGCDEDTRDRCITRMSHRGLHAKKMYIFLLLDIAGFDEPLTLEQDNVPVRDRSTITGNASAIDSPLVLVEGLGITYECVEPLEIWRLRYQGLMRRGHAPVTVNGHFDESPLVEGENAVRVNIDLTYTNDSQIFWYMRDEPTMTLAKNLSQEPWNLRFFQYCLARSHNHCHIEAFGRMKGSISILSPSSKNSEGAGQSTGTALYHRKYNFGTFRDHSWDIRNWAGIDQLFILMVSFETPLVLHGEAYWYLDLTLVHMPGNLNGVQSFTTGYLSGKDQTANLAVQYATSIKDIKYNTDKKDGITRLPLPETSVVVEVFPPSSSSTLLTIECTGDIRRMMYWPDCGKFVVYEDGMDFTIAVLETDVGTTSEKKLNGVRGYGTRQSGFRVGTFDPKDGGVG
jgi:hypothetical protein